MFACLFLKDMLLTSDIKAHLDYLSQSCKKYVIIEFLRTFVINDKLLRKIKQLSKKLHWLFSSKG